MTSFPGQGVEDEEHGGCVVVHHQRVLRAEAGPGDRPDVVLPGAAAPLLEVVLQVGVALGGQDHGIDGLFGQRRPPEVGVDHDARGVDDLPETRLHYRLELMGGLPSYLRSAGAPVQPARCDALPDVRERLLNRALDHVLGAGKPRHRRLTQNDIDLRDRPIRVFHIPAPRSFLVNLCHAKTYAISRQALYALSAFPEPLADPSAKGKAVACFSRFVYG